MVANYLQTHLTARIKDCAPPPNLILLDLETFSYVEIIFSCMTNKTFSLNYNLFRQGHNINLFYKLEYMLHTFEKYF